MDSLLLKQQEFQSREVALVNALAVDDGIVICLCVLYLGQVIEALVDLPCGEAI